MYENTLYNNQNHISDYLDHYQANFENEYSKTAFPKVEEGAVYFCHHDPDLGVIGGACLQPKGKDQYRLSHSYFHIPEDSEIHEDESAFDNLCVSFYSYLLKTIVGYCLDHSIERLEVTGYGDELEDMVFFGRWPLQKIVETEEGVSVAELMISEGIVQEM